MWSFRSYSGFPGGPSDKESICRCRRQNRRGFDPWVGKIPWKRAWQPTPVFLPGDFHDRGAWQATVHGVAQSQTRLKWLSMNTQELFSLCVFTSLPAKQGLCQIFIYWYSSPFPSFLVISLWEAWVLHFLDLHFGRVWIGSARGVCSYALGKWRQKGMIALKKLIFILV